MFLLRRIMRPFCLDASNDDEEERYTRSETPSDSSSNYSFIDEDSPEVELCPAGSLPKLVETLTKPLKLKSLPEVELCPAGSLPELMERLTKPLNLRSPSEVQPDHAVSSPQFMEPSKKTFKQSPKRQVHCKYNLHH